MRLRSIFMLTLALGLGLSAGEPDKALIPSGIGDLRAQLWHQAPSGRRRRPTPVLILHGATFPTACAAAWRMDGRSWMDDLAAAGFDVWGLDFLGYGGSDRYPGMAESAEGRAPLGGTEAMAIQVAHAVSWIAQRSGSAKVFLVAHSAGTFAAGRYAGEHPERVERLVLFGAPGPRPMAPVQDPKGAHAQVSAEDQWEAFEDAVKAGPRPRLTRAAFEVWVRGYLATDPHSPERQPPSVRVPRGMMADYERQQAGMLPYDPAKIGVPTLLIRGAWDGVVGAGETEALQKQLRSAPLKRIVTVPEGGHRMHLEASRTRFFREVRAFLAEGGR